MARTENDVTKGFAQKVKLKIKTLKSLISGNISVLTRSEGQGGGRSDI